MRTRFLMAAVIAAAIIPVGAARAGHCDHTTIVFTRFTARDPGSGEPLENPATGTPVRNPTAESGQGGCTADPSDETLNTFLVYPGANSLVVGSQLSEQPGSGTVTFAGKTTPLTFVKPGGTSTGYAWESQAVYFDQASSLSGGMLTATVCTEGECDVVTYRALA